MTNQQWLETATGVLLGSGLARSQAHLHARLLLDDATGVRWSHLVVPKAPLEPLAEQKLQQRLTDAARGRPIPYILGKAPFFGRDWHVNEKVLIPRPETELLIETALAALAVPFSASLRPKIADLGTGSGIIAVTLALARPDCEIFALDVSAAALEVAARNAAEHGARVNFLRGDGDWTLPLRPHAPFAAVVSNPPYIPAAQIETLEIGVRDFEPRLALDGGADGLAPYREIAAGAAEVLAPGGFVALELGAGQFGEIRAIFEQSGWRVEAARRDLAGIERVLVALPSGGDGRWGDGECIEPRESIHGRSNTVRLRGHAAVWFRRRPKVLSSP